MGDAFAYYLPAYIVATFLDPDEANIAIESAMWQFIGSKKGRPPGLELFNKYSAAQKGLIIEWLEYCVAEWFIGLGDEGYRQQIQILKDSIQ